MIFADDIGHIFMGQNFDFWTVWFARKSRSAVCISKTVNFWEIHEPFAVGQHYIRGFCHALVLVYCWVTCAFQIWKSNLVCRDKHWNCGVWTMIEGRWLLFNTEIGLRTEFWTNRFLKRKSTGELPWPSPCGSLKTRNERGCGTSSCVPWSCSLWELSFGAEVFPFSLVLWSQEWSIPMFLKTAIFHQVSWINFSNDNTSVEGRWVPPQILLRIWPRHHSLLMHSQQYPNPSLKIIVGLSFQIF